MQLRLLLQLLLGAHAWAHALPDGYALSHSLHRRMPPPKMPPPNTHGPTHPRAGNAANHAIDPATGAPAPIVDPVTGQLIGVVNPVTGSSREGFNPMTGQLYGHQPGRMETRPIGSLPLPQPRDEIGIPVPPDRDTPWSNPPPYAPSSMSTNDMIISPDVHAKGEYLSRIATGEVLKNQEFPANDARVLGEWPAINMNKDFKIEYTDAPPGYEASWHRFLKHPQIRTPDDLYRWKRVTVAKKTDSSSLLLDLAVYPERHLVVFIRNPPDKALQLDSRQRIFSELMYQSLRGINPENNFKPDTFIFPDPAERSEIGLAAWRTIALERPEIAVKALPEHTMGLNPHFLEIVGSRSGGLISYMIARHPEDVFGPINVVAVLKGPHVAPRKAVLISLGPLKREG